jgi:aminopeptidase
VIDARVDRMALLLVERMLGIGDGQTLVIDADPLAAELVDSVTARAAARGAHVVQLVAGERMLAPLLASSSVETLEREHRAHAALMATADAILRVDCEAGGDLLADVPAERYAAYLRGRAPGGAIRQARALAGDLRWAVALHPCESFAEAAGMPLDRYRDLVYAAAFCDVEDPVAAWTRQGAWQAELIAVLQAGSELRITAPGTDVRLRVDGRTWRNSCAARNLPDGAVFTGPHETSATGAITFTYPATHAGRTVEGIRIVLHDGVVVEASAAVGEDALHAALATDDGARRVGEVGIGTNYRLDRFTARTLLDEKIGGTVHLAFGSGYPETGSTNRSAEHWDLVCDLRQGGTIELDGVVIQRDGAFTHAKGARPLWRA